MKKCHFYQTNKKKKPDVMSYRGYLCPDEALALHHVLVTSFKHLQHLGNVCADGA